MRPGTSRYHAREHCHCSAAIFLAAFAVCIWMLLTPVHSQTAGSSTLPAGNAADQTSMATIKPIVSVFSSTMTFYVRTQIDPNGDIVVAERSTKESIETRATGRLTSQQMEQLASAFRHWDGLQ